MKGSFPAWLHGVGGVLYVPVWLGLAQLIMPHGETGGYNFRSMKTLDRA
jgi:hypothetical protein